MREKIKGLEKKIKVKIIIFLKKDRIMKNHMRAYSKNILRIFKNISNIKKLLISPNKYAFVVDGLKNVLVVPPRRSYANPICLLFYYFQSFSI
jgi:hypothetical protein